MERCGGYYTAPWVRRESCATSLNGLSGTHRLPPISPSFACHFAFKFLNHASAITSKHLKQIICRTFESPICRIVLFPVKPGAPPSGSGAGTPGSHYLPQQPEVTALSNPYVSHIDSPSDRTRPKSKTRRKGFARTQVSDSFPTDT